MTTLIGQHFSVASTEAEKSFIVLGPAQYQIGAWGHSLKNNQTIPLGAALSWQCKLGEGLPYLE